VGSRNRAKLEAVRRGLAPFFEGVEVVGCEASSGVDAQPLGLEQIVAGARARARAGLAAAGSDLGAGIEDGLIPVPGALSGHVNVGCCALWDGDEDYLGLSAGFEYPPACVSAALSPARVPVGGSFDELFRAPPGWGDPGPGAGNIGRLTRGILTRMEYSAQAVICAAVRMLHRDLYADVPR
jgi:inosine/xanthosine triphosphatase